jgi:hypothetical protein
LRERRFRRPGEHIVFTVRRAGEVKQLELVTRRLI